MIPSQVRDSISQALVDLPIREDAANTRGGYPEKTVAAKEVYERCDCYYERFCGWSWRSKISRRIVYRWKSCWAQGKCARNGPKHQPEYWWCKSTYSYSSTGKPDREVWSGKVRAY